jgi:hypothetical protein
VSIAVYTIEPTGRSMRFAQMRSRYGRASGPVTSNFANGVMSNSAALERVARCSAPSIGDQKREAHGSRVSHSSPVSSGRFASNHCGRSHPAPVTNSAPSPVCRS